MCRIPLKAALIAIGLQSLGFSANAATHTADNASQAAVIAALALATDGDTVLVPAGTATWSSTLFINKAITLQGAGKTQTIITNASTVNNGGFNTALILITDGGNNTLPHRVTGIGFKASRAGTGQFDRVGRGVVCLGFLSNKRVDNCRFDDFYASLTVGNSIGVADHNEFYNGGYAWRHVANGNDQQYAWDHFRPVGAVGGDMAHDSLNYFFYEHNYVEVSGQSSLISEDNCTNYVVRHNTVVLREAHGSYPAADAHNLMECHGDHPPAGEYSTLATLVYDNDVLIKNGAVMTFFQIRGGTGVFFDNRVTTQGSGSGYAVVQLREDTAPGDDLSGLVWPTGLLQYTDKPHRIYVYNNTYNGSVQPPELFANSIGILTIGASPEACPACNAWTTAESPLLLPTDPHPLVQADNPTDPLLSVTPEFRDFGYVNNGATSSLTAVVKNVGGGTLTGTATIDPPFHITGDSEDYQLTANQSHNVFISYDPDEDAALDQDNLVFTGGGGATVQLIGRTPLGLTFESQAGLISGFTINGDSTISQSIETTNPADGARSLYRFKVETAGDHTIAGVVDWPNGGANSVFAAIDAEPTTSNVWTGAVTTGQQSRPLTWGAETTAHTFNLSAGNHDLILRGREAGARMRSFTVTHVTPVADPAITVTPTSLEFGSVAVGTTATLTVKVKNNGGGSLTGVASTVSSGFAVTTGASYTGLASGAEQTVFITYTPAAASANNTGTITFTGGGGTTISVHGTSPASPPPTSATIGVLPASLDFGSVEFGTHSDLVLVVKNNGGGTLSGTASISAPFFIVTADPTYALTANQTKNILVRYQPAGASASDSGSVAFTGGGGASVGVTGTSPAPPAVQPPIGSISGPSKNRSIAVGASVTFSGEGYDPGGNTPLTYAWDFGSGSGISNSTSQNPGSKTFNNAGTFVITFTVSNSLGDPDPHPPTRTVTVTDANNVAVPKIISVH